VRPASEYHQTENSITIDPTNPNNLIVATIGCPITGGVNTPYYYSQWRINLEWQ
jgi:hypothetical protein